MAADPISLIREAWQDGQLAYMSEDATQYRFRNDVSLPKVGSDAVSEASLLHLHKCCACICSTVQKGPWERHGLLQGNISIFTLQPRLHHAGLQDGHASSRWYRRGHRPQNPGPGAQIPESESWRICEEQQGLSNHHLYRQEGQSCCP